MRASKGGGAAAVKPRARALLLTPPFGVVLRYHRVRMPGLETLIAALGGVLVGAGLSALFMRQRARQQETRDRVEIEVRLRRMVVPVLERRADVLGIPPAQRGANEDGPIELALTLAHAIAIAETSGDLPFGDTVEVSKKDVQRELEAKAAQSPHGARGTPSVDTGDGKR